MSPMGPGPRLRSQGQARSMGWLQGQLDPICPRELWVCPDAPCIRIGLWPRPGMYWFSRKVPCAGPAGNMPGCAAAGFPVSSGLPVLSPIAAPRCAVVAGCGANTGVGRGVALCWAARGDWDRVVAAAEGVVMFALPLDSLGRICGCFGWMTRGGTRGARTGAGRNHLCDAGSRRRPLLAPVAGGGAAGGTVEELTSSCGEEEAETSELVVAETARATVATLADERALMERMNLAYADKMAMAPVAVYDIDLDDFSGKCGNGMSPLIRAIATGPG
ncbi:hypothetical protein MRX96_044890 [Rhipicephalus microplus]